MKVRSTHYPAYVGALLGSLAVGAAWSWVYDLPGWGTAATGLGSLQSVTR